MAHLWAVQATALAIPCVTKQGGSSAQSLITDLTKLQHSKTFYLPCCRVQLPAPVLLQTPTRCSARLQSSILGTKAWIASVLSFSRNLAAALCPDVDWYCRPAERDPLHQGLIVERSKLQQRNYTLDLKARLGKTQVVTNTTPINQQVSLSTPSCIHYTSIPFPWIGCQERC